MLGRLSRLQFQHLRRPFTSFFSVRGRAGQQRKRAPVHRHHLPHAEHLAGLRRLRRVHREAIANRQERDVGLVHLADQPHVAEEAGVAGVVERQAVLEPDDEARRLRPCRPSGRRRSSRCCDARRSSSRAGRAMLLRAALVHRRRRSGCPCGRASRTARRSPTTGALVSRAHGNEVVDVIEVAVRDEDQIDLRRLLHRLGTRRDCRATGRKDAFAARASAR